MLIKEIAVILGGSGGDKPDMAFGGTTSLENLPQAIERIKELAKLKKVLGLDLGTTTLGYRFVKNGYNSFRIEIFSFS